MVWFNLVAEDMSQGQGTCIFLANGNTYDFTSLAGTRVTATSGMYQYPFSPCSNGLTGPQGTPASVCQDDSMGNPIGPVSIFDSTMTWSVASNGVQFTTANGAPPLCSPSNLPRFATIQFVCNLNAPNPQFTLANEPNLQGCAVAPGYVFTYQTPLACAGYVPPPPVPPVNTQCPYTLQQPCIIKSFNQYAWAEGLSLDFNQNGIACGKILFSDYVIKAQPVDTCTNATSSFRLIAHMDILAFPKILQLVEQSTPQNPTVFFWDADSNTAAIGPAQTTSDTSDEFEL